MKATADNFGTTNIGIILTGEEWFTLLARLEQKPLSTRETRVYKKAEVGLQQQMIRAANALRVPTGPA